MLSQERAGIARGSRPLSGVVLRVERGEVCHLMLDKVPGARPPSQKGQQTRLFPLCGHVQAAERGVAGQGRPDVDAPSAPARPLNVVLGSAAWALEKGRGLGVWAGTKGKEPGLDLLEAAGSVADVASQAGRRSLQTQQIHIIMHNGSPESPALEQPDRPTLALGPPRFTPHILLLRPEIFLR